MTDRIRAIEFKPGLAWLNVSEPLTMERLRGKVVLLDFWTYCCINCMHLLPDLKKLERKYPDSLVVIGVHSAKFQEEKKTENIRKSILRYEITHPVVNDHEFSLWRQYGIHAWPTLVLIDPEGYVLGAISGEGNYDQLDRLIGTIEQAYREKGSKRELNETPLPIRLESERAATSLRFPGKILATSNRLFIADSNHNRVLVCRLSGEVESVIGEGEGGDRDGNLEKARFNHPQGMAVRDENLYIADTENHLIRRCDLQEKRVETILGTGYQAAVFNQPGFGTKVAINSPWDLWADNGILYVAMAGFHQIWSINLETLEAKPFSGSGTEALRDGPANSASLAQPSGLASDGHSLYVADSEVSAVRAIGLKTGAVQTLVGQDLFEFGDIDGEGEAVRLQHPLGVACAQGVVYVADTYNNKIKILNPTTRHCEGFLGTGIPGFQDGEAPQFYEPGGLSICNGKLYIADTNNHRVRVADLTTRRVETFQLKGI